MHPGSTQPLLLLEAKQTRRSVAIDSVLHLTHSTGDNPNLSSIRRPPQNKQSEALFQKCGLTWKKKSLCSKKFYQEGQTFQDKAG